MLYKNSRIYYSSQIIIVLTTIRELEKIRTYWRSPRSASHRVEFMLTETTKITTTYIFRSLFIISKWMHFRDYVEPVAY